MRRLIGASVVVTGLGFVLIQQGAMDMSPYSPEGTFQASQPPVESLSPQSDRAFDVLQLLEVKGRAPKTGYTRSQFGSGWSTVAGCDMRNTILYRDLEDVVTDVACKVIEGRLRDPYTGKEIRFVRGAQTSEMVQIDHVVALSNAWQTGAQGSSVEQRRAFANDPLNLLAVEGAANQQKADSDAATWLPKHKPFRCQYVARQIAVKRAYSLWVTSAEKRAIEQVLSSCPDQRLPEK